MHWRADKQYIFRSYNTSAFNPFMCRSKQRRQKVLKVSSLALSLIVLKWHCGFEMTLQLWNDIAAVLVYSPQCLASQWCENVYTVTKGKRDSAGCTCGEKKSHEGLWVNEREESCNDGWLYSVLYPLSRCLLHPASVGCQPPFAALTLVL